jgi:uncharacterized protein
MEIIDFKKIKTNPKKIGFFYFDKIANNYLLTNDFGLYIVLTPIQFKKFLEGKIEKNEIYKNLREKGFLKNIPSGQKEKLIAGCRQRKLNLFKQGPSLHIVVVTLRCNFNCIYCQASSRKLESKKYDMTIETAKKTVDFIFNTPNPNIAIEFQGGEPLINWPTVKFIIEYARKKLDKKEKKLDIVMVSNLTLMTDRILEFLIEKNVRVCTSLDGPREIHNYNRPYPKNDSYKATVNWLKKIENNKNWNKNKRVGALVTVSRQSLKYWKEIIDEYLKRGYKDIHLRPITYLGRSRNHQAKINYSAQEFIKFWQKSMDYIISINKKGIDLKEREAQIMLQKILSNRNPGYTDLDSPCGAVLGQIVYNYDGKIYTCDEGRMLHDDTFLVGNINNSYQEIVSNDKTKVMMAASCLENTSCDQCVYKPYCGICPVKNYVYYGTLFPPINSTDHCKIKKAQFRYLFSKIQEKEIKEIFEKWILK